MKPEKAWEPGCAFCLQCTLPTQPVAKTQFLDGLVPTLCRLPLPQTPTVVLIPAWQPPLAPGVFGQCTTLDSQADQDLDRQRQVLGWLLKSQRRSAAELEEERVDFAGWLCTLGCKGGFSTTRKRSSNP